MKGDSGYMAHSNTIFRQLLQLLDRNAFDSIEQNGFKPKRKYRSFTRWSQFVTMTFAHLTNRSSLRDIEDQFRIRAESLYHLGAKPVKRSTLADANNKRNAEFFEALFLHQYAICAKYTPRKRFRFKNKLYSFDAYIVDLCLSLFPWAKFRATKGGIKLHALLDHDGYIPVFVKITKAKVPDIAIARVLKLPPFSIVVMDRAYVDFKLFHKLDSKKVFFVTRLKRGIKYKVTERRTVIRSKGLTSDQSIELTRPKASDCSIPLRRVGYRDPQTGQHYVYVTNIFHLSAKTIADIYKERWQIELFFKWIKQNLKIKSFLGTSKNAVMTQIWVAMVAMLLLAYYKFMAKLNHSLSQVINILQLSLFKRQRLWQLFDPGPTKHMLPDSEQLSFYFNTF